MTSTGGSFKVFERLQPLTKEGFQLIVNIDGETDRPYVDCQICLLRESVTPNRRNQRPDSANKTFEARPGQPVTIQGRSFLALLAPVRRPGANISAVKAPGRPDSRGRPLESPPIPSNRYRIAIWPGGCLRSSVQKKDRDCGDNTQRDEDEERDPHANRNAVGKRVTTGWHSHESREPFVEFHGF
jgi:hypothetical protein